MTATYGAISVEDDGWIVGWIPELPGAIAQERTIEAARESLKEVIGLILETRSAAIQTQNVIDAQHAEL